MFKKSIFIKIALIISLGLLTNITIAQNYAEEVPYFTFGNGFGIVSPDSNFLFNIRFRIQNRFDLETKSGEDLDINAINARVRRARLRFDGFIYSHKLSYVLQLSMSRADMDWDASLVPNVVRDAFIMYKFDKNFSVGIGQTKLPGNRQRVISSGDLQFVDRSNLNSIFTIDRDFGIQGYYHGKIGQKFNIVGRTAISSGEGRNSNGSDNGLAYTARIELLPFGKFEKGGDYFESDLMREKTPKLSIASTVSTNKHATRTGGQLGQPLYENRDINSLFVDYMFKFNGISMLGEYVNRMVDNPITTDPFSNKTRFIYSGQGINLQLGYLLKSNFEIAYRYTKLTPHSKLYGLAKPDESYTLAVTKFIKGHRLKVQSDITYNTQEKSVNLGQSDKFIYRFQIEMGL